MTIDRQNYEEYFMQYADDELNEQQRRSVEAFLLAHPDLAQELELFRDLRMQPDERMVFDGKAGLYRKEDNERKLPVIRWWYVAACLVLLAGLSGIAYQLLRGTSQTKAGIAAGSKPDTVSIAAAGQKEKTTGPRVSETPRGTAYLRETTLPKVKSPSPGDIVKNKVRRPQQPAAETDAVDKDPVQIALQPAAPPEPVLAASALIAAAPMERAITRSTPVPDKISTEHVTDHPYTHASLVTGNEAPASGGYIATKKRAIKSFLHKASHIIGQAADLRKTEQLNIQVGNIEIAIH